MLSLCSKFFSVSFFFRALSGLFLYIAMGCGNSQQPALKSIPATTHAVADPFPFYRQCGANACGAACLRMVYAYHGAKYTETELVQKLHLTAEGASLLALADLSEALGYRARGVRLSYEQLVAMAPLPCIAHWEGKHYMVIYKADMSGVYVADPGDTLKSLDAETFKKGWTDPAHPGEGIILILEKTTTKGSPSTDSTR